MKCIISGVHLKVFGRAIHSLAKIGDELYFQPLEQGLSLRTVNSSRSAYACFLFFPSYFQHYDDGRKEDSPHSEEDDDEGLRCKITMKSVMAVFRSLSTIEKTVEKCKISHNLKEARLIFELHCWHGIVKKHNLAYMESERLQAIFSKDMSPNKMTAAAKLLCEVVVNFQTTQEEVTLSVQQDVLSLKNYVEDEPDPNKVVHTELSLAPEEFDVYQVGQHTSITFCLKELRAILAFGETTGLPININFESAGRPVTFSIDSDQTFEANFVLATLAEADQSTAASQVPQSQRAGQQASQRAHHGAAHSQRGHASKGDKQRGRNTHTNGDISQPPNNRQHARNGPSSSSANKQGGFGDDDDDDAGADISAEEMAAALELEEEWEKQQRAAQAPGSPPPKQRDAHTSSSSSSSPSRLLSSHTHQTKRDRGQEAAKHPHRPFSTATNDQRDRERGEEEGEGSTTSTTTQKKTSKPQHLPQHRETKETNGPESEREAPTWHRSNKPPHHAAERVERRGGDAGTVEGGGERKRIGGERGGQRGKSWQEEEEEEGGEEMSGSPVIPVQCPAADVTRDGGCLQPLPEEEEDDDLDDSVPGTPPAKKFRSLIFGSTQKVSKPAQQSTVLAADTDSEDD